MAVVQLEPASPPPRACAPVLTAVRTLAVARGGMEARLLEAARVTVAACADELLVLKGRRSVEDLTPGQRRKLRAEAKSAALDELVLILGVTPTEVRELIGLSLAGGTIPSLVIHALETGVATWWQVRLFWKRCHRMPVDSAELVAQALFGTDPALAAKDRLDPDGNLKDQAWEQHAYASALAAEATRADGKDPAAERLARRRAYEQRHTSLVVHEDGTATLSLTGDLLSMVAAHTRIDRCARLLKKKSGEDRTLAQLCFFVGASLLTHSTIPLLDKDPDDLSEHDLDRLSRLLAAQPEIALQVVVPIDTLTGSPACPRCGHGLPVHPPPQPTTDESSAAPTGRPTDGPSWPPPGWSPPAAGGLGRILGPHGAFITPGHARELALRPGTTIHRLLTDAADGRLMERTQRTYRPDAAMRAQILAADRYCRGPGTTTQRPAEQCEIDHVMPWSSDEDGHPTGGPTSPANLAALAQHPHHRKTRRELAVIINQRRDLTWTTLLARTITTRSHDYRQYQALIRRDLGPEDASDTEIYASYQRHLRARYRDAAADLLGHRTGARPTFGYQPPTPAGDLPTEDRDTLRDLACRALYAALVHRGPDAFLADPDDYPGATEHGGDLAGWMFVPSRSRGTHPTPERVLHLVDEPEQDEPDQQTHAPTDAPWSRRPGPDDPPPF